jgi:hypothetical protein
MNTKDFFMIDSQKVQDVMLALFLFVSMLSDKNCYNFSIASLHSLVTNSGNGIPAVAAALGNRLTSVSPGIALVSRMYMSDSGVTMKSDRENPFSIKEL